MTDIDRLDAYLSSEDSPEDALMLSDLDGFLHGIACSPVLIDSNEWLPRALGCAPSRVPSWVIELIAELYLEILEGLMQAPPLVEPIFWQAAEGHVIAMDWCEGFMMAVALRQKEWLRLTESGRDGQLMTPVLVHILDDNGNSALGIPQEELDAVLDTAADAIPETIGAIFQFWVAERAATEQ